MGNPKSMHFCAVIRCSFTRATKSRWLESCLAKTCRQKSPARLQHRYLAVLALAYRQHQVLAEWGLYL
jgi:hypothetical protein